MRLLAVDPGPVQSAYVIINQDCVPIDFGKVPNEKLLEWQPVLRRQIDISVIEMVGHYGTGMPAGQDVFDTCVWAGRFQQSLEDLHGIESDLVPRKSVKLHLCGNFKAKDGNVIQALRDRFAPGVGNYGKGTKAEPGFFHGFKADCWQAFGCAVYARDVALT